MPTTPNHRRAIIGLLLGGGLAGGCPRSSSPTHVPAETREASGAPAEPNASFDVDAGFEPPAELTGPIQILVVSDARLVMPRTARDDERVAPVLPWPEDVDIVPPFPTEAAPGEARPCRREHYLPHDARPLLTVVFDYDAQGRVVRQREDHDTDGTIDFEHRFTYGIDGRPAVHTEIVGTQPTCDGPIPGTLVEHVYRYDRYGAWLGGERDEDLVGQDITSWRLTEYDDAGRPRRWIEHSEGNVERAVSLRWDDQDRLLERVDYTGETATSAERWHYAADERYYAKGGYGDWTVRREQLDPSGRLLVTQHDLDGDGHVDERWEHFYGDGAQGRERRREIDTTGDGEPESITTIRYDEQGRRIEEASTRSAGDSGSEGDSGPEGESVQTWTYDAQGRLLRWSKKRPDTWAEDFEQYDYDAHGRPLRRTSERYQAVDSASDLSSYVEREHWEREYDAQGQLVRQRVLEGDLGPDERIEYIYDCQQSYRRHPRRNPLDHPETAAECLDFE